jgi:hypothetical protein
MVLTSQKFQFQIQRKKRKLDIEMYGKGVVTGKPRFFLGSKSAPSGFHQSFIT